MNRRLHSASKSVPLLANFENPQNTKPLTQPAEIKGDHQTTDRASVNAVVENSAGLRIMATRTSLLESGTVASRTIYDAENQLTEH